MNAHNPASGNDSTLPHTGMPWRGIPPERVERMIVDATTLHGLIEALDLCAGDNTAAINALIVVARPLAKQLADDLSKQW